MTLTQIDAPRESVPLRVCDQCKTQYTWYRSTSRYLKLTYCSSLCETGALGFTIEAALLIEKKQKNVQVAAADQEAVVEPKLVPFELSQPTKSSVRAGDADDNLLTV